MRKYTWLLSFLLVACGHSKKEIIKQMKADGLIVEKDVNSYHMRLQYMPPEPQNKGLLTFRLNVTHSNEAMKDLKDNCFSYGLDSLFDMVDVTDTLHPVDVMRIANGNINGVEYMLLFNRPDPAPGINCMLVFRDWLFTSQLITFPMSGKSITHIDSLSQKI
jgi:hypothetical protein